MTLQEFTNTVCSRKLMLSPEAKEIAQTIISTMRVAESDKLQLSFDRKLVAELSGLFFIQADILVIRSQKSFAIVTPKESMRITHSDKDQGQAA